MDFGKPPSLWNYQMIKAIIVDDEPLAHQVILHHLESY